LQARLLSWPARSSAISIEIGSVLSASHKDWLFDRFDLHLCEIVAGSDEPADACRQRVSIEKEWNPEELGVRLISRKQISRHYRYVTTKSGLRELVSVNTW